MTAKPCGCEPPFWYCDVCAPTFMVWALSRRAVAVKARTQGHAKATAVSFAHKTSPTVASKATKAKR